MHYTEHIVLTVFPFEDLSLQKELGIFCHAFSIDLITELSRFRQFRIVSLSAQGINQEFSREKMIDSVYTDYFIQGSFRCEKEAVRINVQLYHTNTRRMVWGNRFEGRLTRLHEIQDNLLVGVVGVLQQQINYDLLSGIRIRPKVEFGAYEHWLYGMEEVRKGSIEHDLTAREHFQKALEIQPEYSLAYTGMSLTYFNEWSCRLWERWDVSKSGAGEWAQKAIELDDQNYIAAMVMGKILLYEGAYDTAEYYLKKSLSLNRNDPNTLMQIALCFLMLGKGKEATELYEKNIELNPLEADKYRSYGVFIYFETGDYEKAALFVTQPHNIRIATIEAYYAAIYYYLQQYDNMQKHWNLFLDVYGKIVCGKKDTTTQKAVDWIMRVTPYRNKTNLEKFLRHISNGNFENNKPIKPAGLYADITTDHFLKEPNGWKFSYNGFTVQVPELKGFYDIQKLLAMPAQLFHCAELMGSKMDSDGIELIDEKAKKDYQKKIIALQNDINEAEQHSNFPRIEKLQQEYDQLIDYLTRSLGLKGKSRESGATVEKARSAITWRIRNAIARIEQYHPMLGAHLSNAIKTGVLCSYHPDRDIHWITSQEVPHNVRQQLTPYSV